MNPLARLRDAAIDLAALQCLRRLGRTPSQPGVAVFAPHLWRVGGYERQAAALAAWLQQEGLAAQLLTERCPESLALQAAQPDWPLRLFEREWRGRGSQATIARGVLTALRPAPWSVLLCQSASPWNAAAITAARRAGRPCVLRLDTAGRLAELAATPKGRALLRVFRQVDRAVALSAELDDELRAYGFSAAQVRRLPNGRDTAWFRPPIAAERVAARDELGATGPVVLYLGRCEERKRVDWLLRAWPAVLTAHPTAQLWVVGDGDDRPLLEALVASASLAAQVVLWGTQPDPRRFYWAADLYAFASRREGMPNSLLEALACGLPCVAADVGGSRDLLAPDRGLLLPVDAAEAWPAALSALLADPAQRAALGQRGRAAAVAEFEQGLVYQHWRALLAELDPRLARCTS
ncbi:MAG: glycosyltransferase [Fimbriimonadaceae bacterium]|nr:glycosyltransferase [Fimbriimonadaceae bacterium]